MQLTHRNCWLNATQFGWHMGVNDRDVYLHTLPMFHANGWGMPFAVTGMGGRHVVLRKVDGAEILRRIEAHGVTLLCGAPAVAAAVLDAAATWDGPVPGHGTRAHGGGRRPAAHPHHRADGDRAGLGVRAGVRAHRDGADPHDDAAAGRVGRLRRRTERARKLGRAGAPVLGVEVATTDDGEVLARSNVVMEGYWHQPEATAEAIRDGWFHTGDGGHIDDEHYVNISDRIKDVIISGGENVSSIEVEDTLFQHPDVAEVAVIGVPHEKWGETVMALVVLRPGATATEADLIDFCRQRLAHYKCPTSVEVRTELARTATGKLQKFKLRESLLGGPRQAGQLIAAAICAATQPGPPSHLEPREAEHGPSRGAQRGVARADRPRRRPECRGGASRRPPARLARRGRRSRPGSGSPDRPRRAGTAAPAGRGGPASRQSPPRGHCPAADRRASSRSSTARRAADTVAALAERGGRAPLGWRPA